MTEPDGGAADTAVAEAYRQYRPALLRFCAALLHDPVAAEDAVQETFLRASRAIAAGRCSPRPYLFAAARNVCFDMRQARDRAGGPLTPDVVAADAQPEREALDRSLLSQVWEALPERDRFLLAHAFAGYPYHEISRRSGLSAKSVSVGLVRARHRVRRFGSSASGLAGCLAGWRHAARRWLDTVRAALHDAGTLVRGWPDGHATSAAALVAVLVMGTAHGTEVDGPGRHSAGLPPGQPVAVATLAGTAWAAPGTAASRTVREIGQPPSGASPAAPERSTAPPPSAPGTMLGSGADYDSMTASPNYGDDHTVYLEGHSGCPVCGVLYVSHDSGQSWHELGARGFAAGEIVVAYGGSGAPRLFAGTQLGLQESDDGGRSFVFRAHLPGPIAVMPGAPGESVDVVIGAPSALWVYDAGAALLRAGPALPPGMIPYSLKPLPDGRTVLVGVYGPDPSAGALLRCDLASVCTTLVRVPDGSAVRVVGPAVAGASPSYVALANQGQTYVSSDGGETFHAVPVADRVTLATVASDGGAPTAWVAGSRLAGGSLVEELTRITMQPQLQVASGWAALPTQETPGPLLALPDGTMILAQYMTSGQPVTWASSDQGRTWLPATDVG